MKVIQFKIILLIGLLWAAQLASARQFYLMTVEPGTEFWSVYGHTALVIDDGVFGFGVFSFEQEDFYQSFISNKMEYMVGYTEVDDEVYWAKADKRKLTLLPLNISDDAQQEVMTYLQWHFKPENQTYAYDYFLQNCATKIRDILNRAMLGELKANQTAGGNGSYFSHTFPVKNQSMMTFGLAVAYGHMAYQQRSDWELMAFPMFLRESLLQSSMAEWRGELVTKVNQEDHVGLLQFIQTHLFLMLLTIFLLVGLGVRSFRRLIINLWWCVQSLIGFVLLFLWFGTAHEMAAWNVQLLLFSPLACLMIKFKNVSALLWLSVIFWWPLAVWQGSWYLWPLAVINILMLIMSQHHSKV